MTRQPLTKRKQAWANKFKPDVIYGEALNPPAAAEARYQNKLDKMVERMADTCQRDIVELMRGKAAVAYFAEDASISSQARILTDALMKKFNSLFEDAAPALADSFASQVDKASSAALHSSLQKLSGGLSLPTTSMAGQTKEILKATVTENVGLIKSISQKYLTDVQGAVMRSITSGNGLQDLVPELQKYKDITKRRARFIAKDQTRKAFNGMNRGRMEALGIEEAEWLHTGGAKEPRKTHVAMSGKTFKLSEGMYDSAVGRNIQPGEEPGCRCRMKPVIKLKDEEK